MSKSSNGISRGQTVAFRVPSDTPDHVLKQLQKLKDTEKRNFSSKIAEFVIQGASQSISREREMVTIPLPKQLTKIQRDWLKHEHSEALLGSIVYQLISDPVRALSLLASLNSNAIDIDDALYLQEQETIEIGNSISQETKHEAKQDLQEEMEKLLAPIGWDDEDDDLSEFNWESEKKDVDSSAADDDNTAEESIDDLLGGFLASMNK